MMMILEIPRGAPDHRQNKRRVLPRGKERE